MKPYKVKLNRISINYIIEKTGISKAKDAVQRFAELMRMEDIDPNEMQIYVTEMIRRESLSSEDK